MKSVRWSGPAAGSWSSSKRVKNWSLMRKVSCYTSPVRMLVVSAVGRGQLGAPTRPTSPRMLLVASPNAGGDRWQALRAHTGVNVHIMDL